VTWQEVCAIGSVLPLVELGSYHGYPALRVAGKFLVRLGDDYESLEFKAIDPDEREAMLLAVPTVFHLPAGFRGAGVFAHLRTIDEATLRQLLENRWRRIAPRAVVKAYDARM
jgi:hypothetical protein